MYQILEFLNHVPWEETHCLFLQEFSIFLYHVLCQWQSMNTCSTLTNSHGIYTSLQNIEGVQNKGDIWGALQKASHRHWIKPRKKNNKNIWAHHKNSIQHWTLILPSTNKEIQKEDKVTSNNRYREHEGREAHVNQDTRLYKYKLH